MFYTDFQGCRLSSTHFGGGPAQAGMTPSVRPTPESSHVYPVYPTPGGSARSAPQTPGAGGVSSVANTGDVS
ncbi:hypothetical protein GCM10020001_066240 [Nonomuraea salmonea]